MKWLSLLLALAFLAVLSPGPSEAQATISVTSSSFENKFPNELIFRVEATSPADINKITLFYAIKGDKGEVSAYAYPEFTPGKQVKAEYRLNTRKNYIPPGTEMRFYWGIEDSAGGRLESKPSALSYDDVRFQWRNISQGGVTLYWYVGAEDFAKGLLDAGLAAIKRLSSDAAIQYERPMKIWVYGTKAEMDSALPLRSETYREQIVTLGVRLSADVLAVLGSHREVKETLAHELSHMVIHQAAEGPFGSIPAWLDEGLAVNAEENVPGRYDRILQDAVKRDALISLQSLSSPPGNPDQVDLFYAESYSVVKLLLKDRDKMRELLAAFKAGSSQADALKKAYGFDLPTLENNWRATLGLAPRPTPPPGDSRPQAVPSLVPFGLPTPLPATASQPASISVNVVGIAAAGFAILVAVVAVVAGLVIIRRG
ncbi:MAG: hypothetical protein HYX92_20200 [Chloroflexi bacterium]|nr:hypothetical protein [Chloroflexota bacterium]